LKREKKDSLEATDVTLMKRASSFVGWREGGAKKDNNICTRSTCEYKLVCNRAKQGRHILDIYIYIHTYIHIYIHTYIYTYIYWI
jgi:hypothetical protein